VERDVAGYMEAPCVLTIQVSTAKGKRQEFQDWSAESRKPQERPHLQLSHVGKRLALPDRFRNKKRQGRTPTLHQEGR